ncbi:type VII secretion integral membrane protein EccD [Streptacidiphilus fuscans]|uniref:Type VII secretion integral membrane protein EccD n=1 Tax=Streptacidiphilus fuscans TaxID=2789292 RepID=A0A931FF81_9ACTN|nr:type VII secretion integral membrane protein EccD [Streptacidiphilus fuscans]MBF9072587.1 type VII secretion integral membrane protein EccD [Streptacidiphilus fuscans]
MSSSVVAGLCRLRFRTSEGSFELAVPTDVQLADVLPTVLGYAAPGYATPGPTLEKGAGEPDEWILQRLGGEPLSPDRTLAVLELHDGDELHLRRSHEALPQVRFDTEAEQSEASARGGRARWRPLLTHHAALGFCVLALAGGLALLTLPGPHALRASAAALTALLLLGAALAAARSVGDALAGTALGMLAVPYLAMAGLLLPVGASGLALTGSRLLAAGSAAAGAAVLALAAVGGSAPIFLGTVVLALLGVVAGALALAGLAVPDTALVVGVVVVLLGAVMPSFSFRLSGLRLPALPRNAEELQEDIEPFEAEGVLNRALVADGYLLSFQLVGAAALVACLSLAATAPSTGAHAYTATLSVLLLLDARVKGSSRQRLCVLLPGLYGLALLAVGSALRGSPAERVGELAVLVPLAAGLLVVAWTVPGKRLLPYWGRAADLLHTLSAVSLVPLALWGIGLFGKARGLGG